RLRSDDRYLIRLGTLGALSDLELDPLVLLQRPVTGRVDRGEVNEDVRSPTVHRDEAETLLRVEPLDRALRHSPAPLPTCRCRPRTLQWPSGRFRAAVLASV